MEVKFFSKFVAHHPRNLLHIIQESPRWSCHALFLDASLCWLPSPSLAWLRQTTMMSGEAIQSIHVTVVFVLVVAIVVVVVFVVVVGLAAADHYDVWCMVPKKV